MKCISPSARECNAGVARLRCSSKILSVSVQGLCATSPFLLPPSPADVAPVHSLISPPTQDKESEWGRYYSLTFLCSVQFYLSSSAPALHKSGAQSAKCPPEKKTDLWTGQLSVAACKWISPTVNQWCAPRLNWSKLAKLGCLPKPHWFEMH